MLQNLMKYFMDFDWTVIFVASFILSILCILIMLLVERYKNYDNEDNVGLDQNRLEVLRNSIKRLEGELYPMDVKVKKHPYFDYSMLSYVEKKEYRIINNDIQTAKLEYMSILFNSFDKSKHDENAPWIRG